VSARPGPRKFVRFALATAGYLLVLLAIYYAHMRWGRVDVVFYAVLQDVAAATTLAALALWRVPAFAAFNAFEKFQAVLVWTLLGYTYAISVPTVIDRSLSFYILEKLQQRGGALRENRFAEVFTKEYLREHRLVEVRLTEQLESGTIIIDGACVRLTARGQRLASFSRFFRRELLPRHRLLMGRYTDALVDPFRGGGNAPDDCVTPAPGAK
jgi:hypothetical protein